MRTGDINSKQKILFLHGTKTSFNSKWMDRISELLIDKPFEIIRPRFPEFYKKNNENNDQTPRLVEFTKEFIRNEGLGEDLIIIGKSLGAKVAVELAQTSKFQKLVLMGFPITFQTGEVRNERLEKLNQLDIPVQIIQGEYDRYGRRDIIEALDYNQNINIHWIDKSDHNYHIKNHNELLPSQLNQIQSVFKSILRV